MSLRLGDMLIVPRGPDSLPPPRLMKALAVVAAYLHPEWSKPMYQLKHKDTSKESCILCSLTVRDFLRSVGFDRAAVRPVQLVIGATQNEKPLHSVGVGRVGVEKRQGWRGHMVVECAGYLIDTTLYQTFRPAWPALPGMITTPIQRRTGGAFGLRGLSILKFDDAEGYECSVAWLDDSTNLGWHRAPDAGRERRRPVVDVLRRSFGDFDAKDGGAVAEVLFGA